MNHPRAHQVRLPFSVPRPVKGKTPEARVCGICRKNDSRYSCPRCNVAYCSLECFRSQKHAQCSEPFYRETIISEVAQDPKQGLEGKRKMLDMLKRLDEGAEDDEAVLRQLAMVERGDGGEGGEEGDEEEDELIAKLAGVDLDTIDSNALFHLLPQAHRDRFIAALKDPEGQEARRLVKVAVEDGLGEEGDAVGIEEDLPTEMPWWEADIMRGKDEDDDSESDPEMQTQAQVVYAARPDMIPEEVLEAIKVPEGVGIKLRYNVIAVSLAYIHLALSYRLPSLAPDYTSSAPHTVTTFKQSLSQLVPFLTDVRSTIRYDSLRSAWSSIWDIIGAGGTGAGAGAGADTSLSAPPGSSPTSTSTPAPAPAPNPAPDSSVLLRLLSILPKLLHPPIDTTQPPRVLLLLSDLYHFYSTEKKSGAGAIPRKLAFYVVAMRQLKRDEWVGLEREVQREIGVLEWELGGGEEEDEEDGRESGLHLLLAESKSPASAPASASVRSHSSSVNYLA